MNYQQITGETKKPMSLTMISKDLSKILRHTAIKQGIKMDDEGYVKVNDIVRLLFL